MVFGQPRRGDAGHVNSRASTPSSRPTCVSRSAASSTHPRTTYEYKSRVQHVEYTLAVQHKEGVEDLPEYALYNVLLEWFRRVSTRAYPVREGRTVLLGGGNTAVGAPEKQMQSVGSRLILAIKVIVVVVAETAVLIYIESE